MHRHSILQKIFAVALVGMLVCGSVPAMAEDTAETSFGPCTLRVEYLDETTPLSGVDFRVYRVADMEEWGYYEYEAAFADSDVALQYEMTNDEWVSAALDLAAFAYANRISPDMTGTTNRDGLIVFKDIDAGLYLVEGDAIDIGKTRYTPQVFCVVVPDRDVFGNPVYTVSVNPKFETSPVPETPPENPPHNPPENPPHNPPDNPPDEQTHEPEPSPSPEPTPEPTPSPEPAPTPEPSPSPEPTPEPTPEPATEPSHSPQTGDAANAATWGTLLISSAVLLVFLASTRKTKKDL